MSLRAKAGGGDFEIIPAGMHHARCFQVLDLGVHQTPFEDDDGVPKTSHKVRFVFELLGEDKRSDDKPFVISIDFTNSLHEKSKLRPFLESWRGKPFTPEELDGFDLPNVLGAYATIQIMHGTSKRSGREYAFINNALPLSVREKPAPVNENLALDLDAFDQEVFDKLPKWTQETIKESLTWKQIEADGNKGSNRIDAKDISNEKKDVVIEDIGDEPINLDDIPF